MLNLWGLDKKKVTRLLPHAPWIRNQAKVQTDYRWCETPGHAVVVMGRMLRIKHLVLALYLSEVPADTIHSYHMGPREKLWCGWGHTWK